jgi:hypothetical protein
MNMLAGRDTSGVEKLIEVLMHLAPEAGLSPWQLQKRWVTGLPCLFSIQDSWASQEQPDSEAQEMHQAVSKAIELLQTFHDEL